MNTQSPSAPPPMGLGRRRWHAIATVLLGVALVGYFTGSSVEHVPHRSEGATAARQTENLIRVPSYSDMRNGRRGHNGSRHAANFAAMYQDRPGLLGEVPSRNEEHVTAALRARATIRAYDGAPPQIPHQVDPKGTLDCAGCHQNGLRIQTQRAAAMSHSFLSNCLQCHASAQSPVPLSTLAAGPPTDNHFTGLVADNRGPRAWDGAPPTIPHTTHMRENCASCHGTLAEGTRSTHPWRVQCVQCHVSQVDREQRPAVGPDALSSGPPLRQP